MSLKKYNPIAFKALFASLFFLLSYHPANAQCAGSDAAIEICDVANPANQNVNLFNLLGPGAVPGGIWTDPLQSGALDVSTGILNVWDIHLSGFYTYTYTVNAVPGCVDNNATVTVTVGGYSGVTSPNGSACSNDISVNLFQFFIGNSPNPQFNGTWSSPDTAAFNGNILDATSSGLGTFHFVYTMDQVGTCPAMSSTAVVTVYRAPQAGPDLTPFVLCETADLSEYNNLNLADILVGEDSNGQWTEAGTNQLSSPFDSFVDLENLYNTSGPGIYNFTYTVFPTNPVCIRDTAVIQISIEQRIDLTGATLVIDHDICEDEISTATYHAILTQGIFPVPDGSYDIKYHINGPGVAEDLIATNLFLNGIFTFVLDPQYFQEVGSYSIHIDHIRNTTSFDTCENFVDVTGILKINPLPYLDTALTTISTVCKDSDATVLMTNMNNLENGQYQLTYNLVASNKAFGQIVIIDVVNGIATFTIPKELVPNIGNTTIFITHIVNLQTGCEVDTPNFRTFTVVDPPFVTNITADVSMGCQTLNVPVALSHLGILTTTSITYDLSGANIATGQIATFTGVLGNATFMIPGSLLPNLGTTTITITSVKDLITGCSSNTFIPETFTVNPLPDASSLNFMIPAVCGNNPVSVLLTGLGTITAFKLTYTLSGANNGSAQSDVINASGGNAVFVIPAAMIPNYGATHFTVTALTDNQTTCPVAISLSATFTQNPVPNPAAFAVLVPNICIGQPASVLLSGLGSATSMTFTYSLSGANIASAQTQTFVVTGGNAVLPIPAAVVSNAGNTTIEITNVIDEGTGCATVAFLSRMFAVNPLPDVTSLVVTIPDVCVGQAVNVALSGLGNMTSAVITYDLTGVNNASAQTAILPVNAGNAVYVLPAALLSNSGETLFAITNIANNQTSCSIVVTTANESFKINDKPTAPSATDQVLCKEQEATVANLLPSGSQYKWYDSAASTTPLSNDTLVIDGNYFVSETSNTSCESDKTMITVTLIELQPPVLLPDGQNFCGADSPTLLELSAKVSADESVVWYDGLTAGNLLSASQLLQEGATYYGFQSSAGGCISAEALEVKVSLTDCNGNPVDYDFFIPDGFSPNGDTANNTFRIPDIEFLYPAFTYEIYNRYGNVLFKGNINKPAWDGTNTESGNGTDKIAPNGVYFYVVNFNKNNVAPRQGRLYLNR